MNDKARFKFFYQMIFQWGLLSDGEIDCVRAIDSTDVTESSRQLLRSA